MEQNFTGYKIPKNLDFNLIEIKEDLKSIPQLDRKNYYYCFISTINNKWAIPQLCNNPNKEEVKDLKKLLNYLKGTVSSDIELLEEFKPYIVQIAHLDKEIQSVTELNLNKLERKYSIRKNIKQRH